MERRDFFKKFLRETFSHIKEYHEMDTGPAPELTGKAFEGFTEEQVRALKPIRVPGVRLEESDEWVYGTFPGGQRIALFEADDRNYAIFDRIDGMLSVEDIGSQVAQQLLWDPAESYERTRKLVGDLIEYGAVESIYGD